jgi:hypothetical protein
MARTVAETLVNTRGEAGVHVYGIVRDSLNAVTAHAGVEGLITAVDGSTRKLPARTPACEAPLASYRVDGGTVVALVGHQRRVGWKATG